MRLLEQHSGWRVIEDDRGVRQVERMIEEPLDGWWIVLSPGFPNRDSNYTYVTEVRQVRAGEYYRLETFKGPFHTEATAEGFQYHDHTEAYFNSGLPVYADHCLKCGKYAKVLAFDHAYNFAWRVTECASCGIHDSRIFRKEN